MPRPRRLAPRDRVDGWPRERSDDRAVETARQLSLNLQAARGDASLRDLERFTGVGHVAIKAILDGSSWPELETIVKLEEGLCARLLPRDL